MTRRMRSLATLVLLCTSSLAAACVHAATAIGRPEPTTLTSQSLHDTRDDTIATTDTTPLDPAEIEAAQDAAITARLRLRVLADTSLSLAARSCEIDTRHGFVTIRGQATRAERNAISAHAQSTVATAQIDNELEVRDQLP